MRALWRAFASVKLAIVLIIALTAASILGTLIPQGRSAAEYAARYGGLAGPLMALRLTSLYRSAWYLALAFAFGLNILVCTLSRLGPKWRRAFGPGAAIDLKGLSALKTKARVRLPVDPAVARDELLRLLRVRRYRPLQVPSPGHSAVLARKRRLGWFGSDIVHLGLLVILAAGLLSGLGGRRADLALVEGQSVEVPGTAFAIRLDKFETEYYPRGGVKDWKSTVTLIEAGRPVVTRVVEVNHPLVHKGYSFYQTSYGWDWDRAELELSLARRGDPGPSVAVALRPGEKVALDRPGLTHVAVRGFVPDFVLGPGSEVRSRSAEPNNPAALVEVWDGESKVFSGWVFAKYPEFGRGHGQDGRGVVVDLKAYRAAPYSVLEAAKDPGANLIWSGSLLLAAGLFLAFFWAPREVRAVVEERADGSEIVVGGHAPKGREAFEAELSGLVASLRSVR